MGGRRRDKRDECRREGWRGDERGRVKHGERTGGL